MTTDEQSERIQAEQDNWTIIKILEEMAGTEVKGTNPAEQEK